MNETTQRPKIAGTPEELYNSTSRPLAQQSASPVTPAPPPIRKFPPLFKCLGYVENAQGYRRYAIAFGDPERIVIRRASEMIGLDFLLNVYPNTNYWRARFPRSQSKVDTKAAAAWFIHQCQEAGPYEPPEPVAYNPKPTPLEQSEIMQ